MAAFSDNGRPDDTIEMASPGRYPLQYISPDPGRVGPGADHGLSGFVRRPSIRKLIKTWVPFSAFRGLGVGGLGLKKLCQCGFMREIY
jgi:hypothetical protein